MLPVGERALAWIDEVRQRRARGLVVSSDENALFVSRVGQRLGVDWPTEAVRRFVDAAELGKHGSCHLFRHSMATLMLEGGADVRFVQEMLGHAKLETTQIYTRVSIKKLQEVHALTHPGARLRPTQDVGGARSAATLAPETDELLLSLAAEAAEEDGVTP